MVLVKEYRICMPLTCEEYKVGQLYMIARHSMEQSTASGDGIEIITNEPCLDEKHGNGRFTEKRIYLSRRLPAWLQAVCPRIFYITEKSWNFYPFTKTEYTCSFVPKLQILINTNYEDNNGNTENSLNLSSEELDKRLIDYIDIAFDHVSNKHYTENEDPKFFKSTKTNRGYLVKGWRNHNKPIMCSYKLVEASFNFWGLQTKAEEYIQRTVREVLLLGHRQAFTWIDEWYNMTMNDVRAFEAKIYKRVNEKMNPIINNSNSSISKGI